MSIQERVEDLHEDYDDVDKYEMEIEETIVDKLGLNMYDKVSAVISELVANSYDADAENVLVRLPLGKYLATRLGDGSIDEKGYEIEVIDDGHGMTPQEAQKLFLRVGRDRRYEQGDTSREKDRPVMGRKGIGKLAPFGICNKIEILSAGGPSDKEEYKISHFEMDYEDIIEHGEKDTKENYSPKRLNEDGEVRNERGTKIVLKDFNVKRVPKKDTFSDQLSYRFAKGLPDFGVVIEDVKKDNPESAFTLDEVDIPIEENTKVDVDDKPVKIEPDDEFLGVKGWIGMAKEPYGDDFGGVRIYVRGRLASITKDFGMGAGWTGEYVARSYLVGEVHADWLDEGEKDLVQTHRQDILWESKRGQALQKWGEEVVKEVSKKGKEPRRQNVKQEFLEKSELEDKAKERFGDKGISETAVDLGEKFGRFAHEDELDDDEYVEDFSDFIVQIAPHKHLVDAFHDLRERAEGEKIEIDDLIELFEATNIAEVTTYGQVAAEKVKTIDALEEKIRDEDTTEGDLHEILEEAPWIINPEWQPVTSDKSLQSFRSAFEAWYEETHDENLATTTEIDYEKKRPDFVMIHEQNSIRVIELKKPDHEFDKKDYDRFERYVDAFERFFEQHRRFKEDFPEEVKFTLVCDGMDISGTSKRALKQMKQDNLLEEPKSWEELLHQTKKRHKEFMEAKNEIPTSPDGNEGSSE